MNRSSTQVLLSKSKNKPYETKRKLKGV